MNLYFNPLPPHGGRHRFFRRIFPQAAFQSTPSTRRETLRNRDLPRPGIHFNPLPPHGGRHDGFVYALTGKIFQSTPSTRRETGYNSRHYDQYILFQSTPSTRRETTLLGTILTVWSDFNPLPPHGGRPALVVVFPIVCAFQSTPSTRRET